MNIIRCSHCGTTNRAGSNFCNRCGTALQSQPDWPEETADEMVAGEPTSATAMPSSQVAPTEDQAKDAAANLKQGQALHAPKTRADGNIDRGEGASPFYADDSRAQQSAGDAQSSQLIEGVSGLLAPIRVTSDLIDSADGGESPEADFTAVPRLTTPVTQLRRIRALIARDPVLVEHQKLPTESVQIRLHYPWLIILLLLAIGLPLLLELSGPVGEARRWPGVADAYTRIDQLTAADVIWILWDYDPATAGEMDLVAQPLVDHLLEHNVQAIVVSLLPTGLATAQRLWRSTSADLAVNQGIGVRDGRALLLEAAYLPGGAAALALLASAPEETLWGYTERTSEWLANVSLQQPTLTVVVSAHPESVQHWLELVQTERQHPVLAFTGAGGEPLLRPYVDSGQLAGLVTGFDGAAAYQQLRDRRFGRLPSAHYTTQLIAQNWGHAALILLLVLGNLRAIWLGGKRA